MDNAPSKLRGRNAHAVELSFGRVGKIAGKVDACALGDAILPTLQPDGLSTKQKGPGSRPGLATLSNGERNQ
jgi:hypothetical protein